MDEPRTFQLPGEGLLCGQCRAPLLRVTRTINGGGFISRERICPQCQFVNVTTERVIHTRQKRRYFHEPLE